MNIERIARVSVPANLYREFSPLRVMVDSIDKKSENLDLQTVIVALYNAGYVDSQDKVRVIFEPDAMLPPNHPLRPVKFIQIIKEDNDVIVDAIVLNLLVEREAKNNN